jgi:uncharacterized protein YoxC|tara:strand:+ start:745 stop:948 length:204 start_codon:yes stop_codon:yes gene_type:complete
MDPQDTQAFGTELLMQNSNMLAEDLFKTSERVRQLEKQVTDLRRDLDSAQFFINRILDKLDDSGNLQ